MSFYTETQRKLQAQYDATALADAVAAAVVEEELNEAHAAFISSRDFFFLSTVNARGEPTVSHKGGGVGMVRVLDSKTLAFPAYDGNGMFLSMGNIADAAKIGLLFMDFETPQRIRVQATASLADDDPLLAEFPGAIMVVRARVDAVFINCARYIHKHKRIESSRHIPDAEGKQPLATWKRIDGLQDHLPHSDQGRVASEGGTITEAEYGEALSKGES